MSPEPFTDRSGPDPSTELRDSVGNRPEAYFADGPGGRYCVRREPVMTLPPGTRPGYGRPEDIRLIQQWQAEFHAADPGPLSMHLPLVLYKGDDFEEACAACDSDYDRRQRAWLWAQTHANTDPITEDRIRELIRDELHREFGRDGLVTGCHTAGGDSQHES